jgi:SAM-dependent methyltransferase
MSPNRHVLYDLGCGDGRVAVMAARRHGCRAVGVDIDPRRVRAARERAAREGVAERVRIEEGDLFEVDLRRATVVFLYLSSSYNARLRPQLAALRPGARVVSHQFGIAGVPAARIVGLTSRDDGQHHTLLLWRAPLEENGASRAERPNAGSSADEEHASPAASEQAADRPLGCRRPRAGTCRRWNGRGTIHGLVERGPDV